MSTKFYKNEKFQVWFYPILYLILIIGIVITCCFIFNKKYYQPIVVTGESMWPTLAGGRTIDDTEDHSRSLRYHYGLADLHRSSVNELQRFDVVVTYYPQSWGLDGSKETYLAQRSFKIKRVWGFPGETISMRFDTETSTYTFKAIKPGKPGFIISSSPVKEFIQSFECYSGNNFENHNFRFTVNEFALPNKTFRVSYTTPDKQYPPQPAGSTSFDRIREFSRTLHNDEYFVMGDNWRGSTDCFEKSNTERLTTDYLQGRVVCINSYVTYNSMSKDTSNSHSIERMYEF